MLQGHDTVSAAIAHTVHLLGANSDAQRKCQQELDEIMGESLMQPLAIAVFDFRNIYIIPVSLHITIFILLGLLSNVWIPF